MKIVQNFGYLCKNKQVKPGEKIISPVCATLWHNVNLNWGGRQILMSAMSVLHVCNFSFLLHKCSSHAKLSCLSRKSGIISSMLSSCCST